MDACEPSGPEICDGVDQDCNGVIDDGELCEEPEECRRGECRDTPGTVKWARAVFGPGVEAANAVLAMSNGNVLLAGTHETDASYMVGGVTFAAQQNADVFVAEVDASGGLVNHTVFGSNSVDFAVSLAPAGSMGAFVGGQVGGAATWGGDSVGGGDPDSDAFTARLQPGLTPTAVTTVRSPGDDGPALVAAMTNGWVVATTVSDSPTFEYTGSPMIDSPDVLIATFGSSGMLREALVLGGPGVDEPRALAVDNENNIYVGGNFEDRLSTPSGGMLNSTSTSCFLVALDSTLAGRWADSWDSQDNDELTSVAVLPDDSIVVTGWFRGSSLALSGAMLMNVGDADMYLARFGPMGGDRWAEHFGGPGFDGGQSIAISPEGVIHVAVTNFGADLMGRVPEGEGNGDGVVLAFGQDGTLQWATKFGGAALDRAVSISVGPEYLFVSGTYEGMLIRPRLPHMGQSDAFLIAMEY